MSIIIVLCGCAFDLNHREEKDDRRLVADDGAEEHRDEEEKQQQTPVTCATVAEGEGVKRREQAVGEHATNNLLVNYYTSILICIVSITTRGARILLVLLV